MATTFPTFVDVPDPNNPPGGAQYANAAYLNAVNGAVNALENTIAAGAGGDLPEFSSSAQTAAVGTATNLLGKTTRFDTTSAAINQTLPAATAGRVIALGWSAGTNTFSFTAAGSDVIGMGSGTTGTLAFLGEVLTLHCTNAGRWLAVSSHKPTSALDSRYRSIAIVQSLIFGS